MALGRIAVIAVACACAVALGPAAAVAQVYPTPPVSPEPAADPAVPAADPAVPTAATAAPPEPAEEDPAVESPAGCGQAEDELEQVEAAPPVAEPATEDVSAARRAPPEAHCSQDAGNQQYQDPFAGAGPPEPKGEADSSQAPEQNTPAPPANGSVPASQALTADSSAAAAGEGLPNTGLGLGGLVALGVPLLLTGLALRRRLA